MELTLSALCVDIAFKAEILGRPAVNDVMGSQEPVDGRHPDLRNEHQLKAEGARYTHQRGDAWRAAASFYIVVTKTRNPNDFGNPLLRVAKFLFEPPSATRQFAPDLPVLRSTPLPTVLGWQVMFKIDQSLLSDEDGRPQAVRDDIMRIDPRMNQRAGD